MTIALLNKSDLSILNKQALKYKLADAEKDKGKKKARGKGL